MIQKKKTDFLRRLEFIEKMISCYFTCPSLRTQRALALGISIEAQTLVAELAILKDKWHTRLPFWEDWDVRFVEWTSKIKSWIDKKDSMYEPYNDTVPYFDTEIFYPLLDSEEDEHNNVLSSAISTIKKDVENFENSEYVGKACCFFGDGIVFDYIFDGTEYAVDPRRCSGYSERFWGKGIPEPYFHLSSANLFSFCGTVFVVIG